MDCESTTRGFNSRRSPHKKDKKRTGSEYDLLSFSYFGENISIYVIEMDTRALFLRGKHEPFIGLEPMTYALPWRYSTAELKGPPHHI